MKFNPSQMEVFCVVVECGSIRAAARRLGLTQPAVTYVVRELERQFDTTLFVRQSRGVVLTAIGESLYRRALRLLEEWRQTQDELEQLRDGSSGSLRLAFSSSGAARVLAPALESFRRSRPRVRLDIHELLLSDPRDLWKVGQYDFAVISELDEPVGDDLDRQVLFRAPLHVMARRDHPLAKTRSLRELRDCLWVLPGYGPRVIGREMMAVGGGELPRQVMRVQSLYIALSLVRSTDALVLMSTVVLDDPQVAQNLVALPLSEPLPQLRVSLVSQGLAGLTPAAREFADCLLAAGSSAITPVVAAGKRGRGAARPPASRLP